MTEAGALQPRMHQALRRLSEPGGLMQQEHAVLVLLMFSGFRSKASAVSGAWGEPLAPGFFFFFVKGGIVALATAKKFQAHWFVGMLCWRSHRAPLAPPDACISTLPYKSRTSVCSNKSIYSFWKALR